jgi:hypothetical protein
VTSALRTLPGQTLVEQALDRAQAQAQCCSNLAATQSLPLQLMCCPAFRLRSARRSTTYLIYPRGPVHPTHVHIHVCAPSARPSPRPTPCS